MSPESHPSPEKNKKGGVLIRATVALAGMAMAANFIYKEVLKTNDSDYLDIPVTPIEETINKKPFLTPENIVDRVELFDKMPFAEFEQLPATDKLAYADYLVQKTEAQGVYKKFYGTVDAPGYQTKTSLAPVKTEYSNMLDYQAVNNYVYLRQISMLQTKTDPSGDNILDKEAAKKIVGAVFYKNGNDTTPKYAQAIQSIDKIDTPSVVDIDYRPFKSSGLMQGDRTINGDTQQIKYKEVYFYSRTDIRMYYARFILSEYTDFEGNQKNAWLMDDLSTKPDGYSIE